MERGRRVYHPTVAGEGAEIVLDLEETHHAIRVLRLRPGDPVSVFDGRGREWEAVLVSSDRGGAAIRTGAEMTDLIDPTLPVTLFQGLCRPERMEWVIQKGTEVGLHAIRPFAARRSEVDAPSAERLRRYRRVALEAAKQSGRRFVPDVSEPLSGLPLPPSGVLALLLDGGPEATPMVERLARQRPESVWLAVGPEGGFEPAEVAALVTGGWWLTGLGPRTLRTETAGVAAAALVLHAWDDFGAARPMG
jgi:16S rRNA (uracil1498-N3)-methyltransferase